MILTHTGAHRRTHVHTLCIDIHNTCINATTFWRCLCTVNNSTNQKVNNSAILLFAHAERYAVAMKVLQCILYVLIKVKSLILPAQLQLEKNEPIERIIVHSSCSLWSFKFLDLMDALVFLRKLNSILENEFLFFPLEISYWLQSYWRFLNETTMLSCRCDEIRKPENIETYEFVQIKKKQIKKTIWKM